MSMSSNLPSREVKKIKEEDYESLETSSESSNGHLFRDRDSKYDQVLSHFNTFVCGFYML